MKHKTLFTCLLVLALASLAQAQTKISGAGQVGKPDLQYRIEMRDRPNHFFMISQGKFTWTKPWEIAGIQAKEGVFTEFQDMTGDTSRFRGVYVDTMANGDQVHYRYQGTATMKDGVLQSLEQKWNAIRGTGKLRGIKGEGSCKGTGPANPDGTVSAECEGEYQLPK